MNGTVTPKHLAAPALLALLMVVSIPLRAQVTTARLEGTVKDKTGGVIPGATVVAKNQGTNLPYEAITNELGMFVLPKLPPGSYTIVVTANSGALSSGAQLNLVVK